MGSIPLGVWAAKDRSNNMSCKFGAFRIPFYNGRYKLVMFISYVIE